LPVRRLLGRLREEKIPTEISNSLGTFGCNQIFYHLMDYVERKQLGIPAGFIHVPPLPEQVHDKQAPSMALETTTRALEVVVDDLASSL
jgi:pyroglutamyl-peptidase